MSNWYYAARPSDFGPSEEEAAFHGGEPYFKKTFGRPELDEGLRKEIKTMINEVPKVRWTSILDHLGIAGSTWYRVRPAGYVARKPGRKPHWVVEMAQDNPWYGYRRIAVMCWRSDQPMKDRQAYLVMKEKKLLQRKKPRKAEIYQAAKLFELLAMHLTSSYCATEATYALRLAREKAEEIHGPLTKQPFLVTDNGSSFIAKRFCAYIKDDYTHVRIQYRTPTQLGLLERFHRTLMEEEVYWRLYGSPQDARNCLAEFHTRYNTRRPHWALIPPTGGDPLTPQEVYEQGRKVGIPKWQGWAKAAREKLDQMMLKEAVA